MKRAVVLHADIAARPYRIEDFRQPLSEAGVLGDVARFGAYQMSHVWLLDLRTDAAKQKLLEIQRLDVKGRTCLVVDPVRQDVRLKLHWVAFDVTNDAIRRAFAEFGEVKEVVQERWKVSGFDGVESTTRLVRVVLREGVSLDRLPHQLRLGSGTVLVVVPGRAPICLKCRKKGHIRRDCTTPRCTDCRAFGHERADCVRTYARAAGRGASDDQHELVMDEDEAERAATPLETVSHQSCTEDKSDKADSVTTKGSAPPPSKPSTVAPEPTTATESRSETPAAGKETTAELATNEESEGSEMIAEAASIKRRHEDVVEAARERRLRQLERAWNTEGPKRRVSNRPQAEFAQDADRLAQ